MQRSLQFAVLLGSTVLTLLRPAYISAQQAEAGSRRLLTRVVPQYPSLARSMHIEGTVKVLAVVAPNGRTTSTKVIGGHPLLAKSAVEAIEKWKWAPAPEETKEPIELRFHQE